MKETGQQMWYSDMYGLSYLSLCMLQRGRQDRLFPAEICFLAVSHQRFVFQWLQLTCLPSRAPEPQSFSLPSDRPQNHSDKK